jgi:phosphoglycolate phosphatase-like HAD superfamily hydrolase
MAIEGRMNGSTVGRALDCVVLFDIDGTLLTGPGRSPTPGMVAMDASAHRMTGHAGLHQRVEFAGRTDRQIARDLLLAGGRGDPTEEEVASLIETYLEALERGVRQRAYRPLGQVREAVEALRGRGAVVGLGTGNVVRGARVKLESAGLLDLFDLSLGGYGDDADSRDGLLRVGARRCDPAGRLPVVVVGDTPHDVRAALAIEARCIAVTTGFYDEQVLRASGADDVIDVLDAGIVGRLERMLGAG